MNIVLLGPPGAGKGTQAKFISERYGIPHISTGDIFRSNISKETKLGNEAKKYIQKGLLVPDEITINMLKDRLQKNDCRNGFLLDGFPRTEIQAKSLDEYLQKNNSLIDNAILIQVPKEEVLQRITGRRVCLSCGASYHTRNNPPKVEGKCDSCGSDLVQRTDDNENTVLERLNVYDKQIMPIIKYYRDKKVLKEVDGTLSINDIFETICSILGER